MDKLIADLLAGMSALAVATEKNTSVLERVLAGQEAAIARHDAGKGGSGETTTRRTRRTAAEMAADAAAAEKTPPPAETTKAVHPLLADANGETVMKVNPKTKAEESTPTGNYRASDFTPAQVKSEFIGWLGDTEDADEKKARAGFVKEVGQHFGVDQVFHAENGLKDPEQIKQTLFYLRRKREGLKVDFGADYDFDGDPLADQTQEAVEDDEVDALG